MCSDLVCFDLNHCNLNFVWLLHLTRCQFHPVLLQWQVKDPGHSAKSAGGRLHLNTHTPLTQRRRSGLTMLPRQSEGTYHGNELTRNSSGNTRPQSSPLAELLWTDPGVKVELVCAGLFPFYPPQKKEKKKKKSAGGKWIAEPSPQILTARKKLPL